MPEVPPSQKLSGLQSSQVFGEGAGHRKCATQPRSARPSFVIFSSGCGRRDRARSRVPPIAALPGHGVSRFGSGEGQNGSVTQTLRALSGLFMVPAPASVGVGAVGPIAACHPPRSCSAADFPRKGRSTGQMTTATQEPPAGAAVCDFRDPAGWPGRAGHVLAVTHRDPARSPLFAPRFRSGLGTRGGATHHLPPTVPMPHPNPFPRSGIRRTAAGHMPLATHVSRARRPQPTRNHP